MNCCAGDRAEPGPLNAAVEQLRAKKVKEFATPEFVKLAADLETRAAEIAEVAPGDWAGECRRRAGEYAPVTDKDVATAKASLKKVLDAFERRVPSLRKADGEWTKWLYWPETRALVTADPVDGADARSPGVAVARRAHRVGIAR